ncbi:FAD-dependent thymidylate synthase [Streptomyces sp. NPDC007971]|uniref:FAD-dependent thymidylate synthase n=1 Tax=Streptomyces sp. NPDC007971 TaxID=3364799 RepID=UPI0036E09EB6
MTTPTFRSDITVELVKHNAADTDVLFAARVSTGTKTLVGETGDLAKKDLGLINYLMRDKHGSPFEHNSMTFRIEAPIFVIREWMRHRSGWSYNEESGRYTELKPVFYIPSLDRKLVQEGKPGRYTFVKGTAAQHEIVSRVMEYAYQEAYEAYQALLDAGIAREVARSTLPVGLFSSMYATCNARSLMHFLGLRTADERATFPSFPQREIEMAAEQMERFWAQLMPATHAAFNTHGRVAP